MEKGVLWEWAYKSIRNEWHSDNANSFCGADFEQRLLPDSSLWPNSDSPKFRHFLTILHEPIADLTLLWNEPTLLPCDGV